MIWIIITLFVAFFGFVIYTKKKDNKRDVVSVYFGVPGAGKTTMAAYLAKKYKKQNGVFSNVPITGTYKLDPKKDLGVYDITNAAVIIDEASIEFNNRKYKEFPETAIYFFKYHRHHQCAVDIFSQDYEDFDITIRRLAQRFFVMEKCFLPWFVKRKSIGKCFGIDQNTKQPINEYFWIPFGTKYIFSPPLWKTFNTISRKKLPEKNWEMW